MKTLIIINPKAGRAKKESYYSGVVKMLAQSGMEITVKVTRAKGDARDIASALGGQNDLVICAGGDGTLNEVVTGLMALARRPKLGYIPAGTTNDFASSLKIPKNIKKAAKVIIAGKSRLLDIGQFQTDKFVYSASFGFLTEVAYKTNQKRKSIFGWLAYFFEGAKRLGDFNSYGLSVEYDGQRLDGDFVFGAIANTYKIGGLIEFKANEVDLSDGKFELLLIKKPQAQMMLWRTFIKLINKQIDKNYVVILHASDIKISSAKLVPWCLDGEDGGLHSEIAVKNQKEILKIIVP